MNFNKIKIILIIISAFLFYVSCFAQTKNVYYNAKGHFSFLLPDGWEKYSQKDLHVENAKENLVSGKNEACIAAFYKTDGKINSADMNVQVDVEGRVLESDIQENMLSPQGQQQLIGGVQELVKDKTIEFGKLSYNPERKIVYSKMLIDDGQQKKVVISAMLMSNYGFVTASFYSLENDLGSNLDDFAQIIDSFKFDEGCRY